MTDQMPPEHVAHIDQQMAQYGTNLDTMIGLYRSLIPQFGTAGAQARMLAVLVRRADHPQAQAACRNLLIAAIARLADAPQLPEV